ncbi:hypothetical protein PCANC_14004 [Puccinia coronata f. sp. avenae]|uniref:DDE Tnp4 domain-containing protein n=1 Tax=Puccinia coronata f. sp. avenae TaxID=200324 RepID=A0A2N5UGX1_9BASI|nr:hypothetical protein PCANC_22615 [Puccinia coronata f. sp. avenae]PLW37005.1 hypothetical protein PCANC_14004 [Puccinia coronata f. sp. avenae]
MLPLHLITATSDYAALFLWLQEEANHVQNRYIQAPRHAFKRPPRWEPWNDSCVPMIRFIELFRVTIDNFHWLSNSLCEELQQDPRGRGERLTVEAQVAVGLYCLGHSSSYLTIGHVFNIGKETADKAASRFVLAVLKVLRLCTMSS